MSYFLALLAGKLTLEGIIRNFIEHEGLIAFSIIRPKTRTKLLYSMRRLFWRRPKADPSDSEDLPKRTFATLSSTGKNFPSGLKLLYNSENSLVE